MSEHATPLPREVLRDIAKGLSAPQARWLVDFFYAVQDYRIQASGQLRSMKQGLDEGVDELYAYLFEQMQLSEKEIAKALVDYSDSKIPGQWLKTITGIGPIISAGLLAHIDITQTPTVGHIWSFAGLNPEMTWEKGQKRPYNAKLKVLCWKLGDSFVKQSGRAYQPVGEESTGTTEGAEPQESTGSVERAIENESTAERERILLSRPARPQDLYLWLYAKRKRQEVARNAEHKFADQAARALKERKIKDKELRKTYKAGLLPPGRLELRARRYAVKLLLSHLHHVMYVDHFDEDPPFPYILTKEPFKHAHYIAPPGWPLDKEEQ